MVHILFMTTPLPTFRALLASANALHLAATPADGMALVLRAALPCLPLTDAALAGCLQNAQTSLDGAIAAFSALSHLPDAQRREELTHAASRAYHVALMAYFGVDVSA